MNNNKGFTLIELLATIVVLSIVVGLTIMALNINTQKAKDKTEEAFVNTLENAIEIYIDTVARNLSWGSSNCVGKIEKQYKIVGENYASVKIYKKSIKIGSIIDKLNTDGYSPLGRSDIVNPANEKVSCNLNAYVNIYRDADYVYYYEIDDTNITTFGCLKNSSKISTVPEIKGSC